MRAASMPRRGRRSAPQAHGRISADPGRPAGAGLVVLPPESHPAGRPAGLVRRLGDAGAGAAAARPPAPPVRARTSSGGSPGCRRGGSGNRLRRLEAAGLLAWSESAIAFPASPEDRPPARPRRLRAVPRPHPQPPAARAGAAPHPAAPGRRAQAGPDRHDPRPPPPLPVCQGRGDARRGGGSRRRGSPRRSASGCGGSRRHGRSSSPWDG